MEAGPGGGTAHRPAQGKSWGRGEGDYGPRQGTGPGRRGVASTELQRWDRARRGSSRLGHGPQARRFSPNRAPAVSHTTPMASWRLRRRHLASFGCVPSPKPCREVTGASRCGDEDARGMKELARGCATRGGAQGGRNTPLRGADLGSSLASGWAAPMNEPRGVFGYSAHGKRRRSRARITHSAPVTLQFFKRNFIPPSICWQPAGDPHNPAPVLI